MGHNQLNGPRRVKTHSEQSSSKRRLRRSRDRGTIAEITEQLRTSREQHVIRRSRHIWKRHVENPRESYTHTSTLFSSIFRSFLLKRSRCNIRSCFTHCIRSYSSIKSIFAYRKLIISLCSKDIAAYIIYFFLIKLLITIKFLV